MNRVLKFRAFDKTNNQMFYWELPNFDSKHASHYDNLMQFTGLLDKNGVEIYEGDIIKTERNTIEVFYGKKDFNVIFYGKKDIIEVSGWLVKNKKGETDVLDASFCEGEIIGNIYQNPELLSTN